MDNSISKTLEKPNVFAPTRANHPEHRTTETQRRIDFLLTMRTEYDAQGWDWPRHWQEELIRLGMIAYAEKEVSR